MSDIAINFEERLAAGICGLSKGAEVWFDHPNFLGYFQGSNLGNVRSLDRLVRGNTSYRPVKGRMVLQKLSRSDYAACGFSMFRNHYNYLVHRFILETFIGPCPEGMECRHLDGVKMNNRIDNLLWGTKAENAADKVRHRTLIEGPAMYNAKLKAEDIPKIHALYETGLTQKEVAEAFGMSGVAGILRGENYKSCQPTVRAKMRGRGGRLGEKNGRARFITFNGRTMILKDWAAELCISPNSLRERIREWGLEEALTTGKLKPWGRVS